MISTDFPYRTKRGTFVQGGGSACIAQMIEGIRKKGHEVAVVTRFERDSGGELFNIPIYRARHIDLGFRESKITHTATSIPALLDAVGKFKPDVIHSHNPPAAVTAILATKIKRKPHVLTMHGPWSGVRLGGMRKKIAQLIERFAVTNVDAVMCDSHALAHEMKGQYGIRAIGIQNAVDKEYYAKIDKKQARKELGITSDGRIVLYTGRFVREKGLDTLLHAAREVLNDVHDVTFLLIGGGFDEEIVRTWLDTNKTYAPKIQTIPFLPHERMREAYAAADIFVLPTRAEGLSRALMEAMLFGVPAIATSVGGNVELLENGRGVLVQPQDPHELARAIKTILGDESMARERAAEAREYVIKNLTVEKRIDKIIEVYESVV